MFFTIEMKWSNFPRNNNTLLFATTINYSAHRAVHVFGLLKILPSTLRKSLRGKGVRHEIVEESWGQTHVFK